MHPAKMMGFVDDKKKVSVDERWWAAAKLALWRQKVAWTIVQRQAESILAGCRHEAGCEGQTNESASCRPGCPDLEARLSALVIVNAARQFSPIDARKLAEAPYTAPSREYFSEVVAELVACQAELEALKAPPQSTLPAPAESLPADPSPPLIQEKNP
jgi:hypothetical protein